MSNYELTYYPKMGKRKSIIFSNEVDYRKLSYLSRVNYPDDISIEQINEIDQMRREFHIDEGKIVRQALKICKSEKWRRDLCKIFVLDEKCRRISLEQFIDLEILFIIRNAFGEPVGIDHWMGAGN